MKCFIDETKRLSSLLILFLLTVQVPVVYGQGEINVYTEVGIPQGSFGQNTKAVGLGFGTNLIYALDKKNQFFAGADFNYEIYGKEVKSDPDYSYDLITNNNIFMMHAMIRYMPYHEGWVKPYLDIKGGFKHFYTKTKIKEDVLSGDPIEVISEFKDLAASYGSSLGVTIRKYNGIGLFFEASFLAGGNASYVDRKSFERTPDDEVIFNEKNSNTNMILFRFGINFHPIPGG